MQHVFKVDDLSQRGLVLISVLSSCRSDFCSIRSNMKMEVHPLAFQIRSKLVIWGTSGLET